MDFPYFSSAAAYDLPKPYRTRVWLALHCPAESNRPPRNVQKFRNRPRMAEVLNLSNTMHFEHVNNYYSKPTMDAFEALQGTPVAIAITAIAVILILYAAWAPHSTEEAVPFTVPVPEQCLPDCTGEVLEKPSLKVRFPFGTQRLLHANLGHTSRCQVPLSYNATHPQRGSRSVSSTPPRKTASTAR